MGGAGSIDVWLGISVEQMSRKALNFHGSIIMSYFAEGSRGLYLMYGATCLQYGPRCLV